jgi:enamine deaminase RidA (YjgF/YER057c/UK114 family)
MGKREEILKGRGYEIADAPKPGGLYTPVVIEDGVAYLSGAVPATADGLAFKGKVPSQVSVEDATKAAEICAANLLRVFIRDVGELAKIKRLIKVTGFVNTDTGFAEPHVVVNGASQLLLDVLGDAGNHARSAVGMAALPLDAPVEVELILKLVD